MVDFSYENDTYITNLQKVNRMYVRNKKATKQYLEKSVRESIKLLTWGSIDGLIPWII